MADTISINGYSLNTTRTVAAGTVAVTVLGDSPILLPPDQDVAVRGGPDSDGWAAGRVIRRSRGVELTVYLKAVTGGVTALQQAGAELDAALATYPGEMLWSPDGSPNTWRVELPGPLSSGAVDYLWERQKQAASQRKITGSAGPYVTLSAATTGTASVTGTGWTHQTITVAGKVPPSWTVQASRGTALRGFVWGLTWDSTAGGLTYGGGAGTALAPASSMNVNPTLGWQTPRIVWVRIKAASGTGAYLRVSNSAGEVATLLVPNSSGYRWLRLPIQTGPAAARATPSWTIGVNNTGPTSVTITHAVGIPINDTTGWVSTGGGGSTLIIADALGVSVGSGWAVPTYTYTSLTGAASTYINLARPVGREQSTPTVVTPISLVALASDAFLDDSNDANYDSLPTWAIDWSYNRTEWWPAG